MCSGLIPALLPVAKNSRSPLWAKLRITTANVTYNVIGYNNRRPPADGDDATVANLRQIYRQLQVVLEDEVAMLYQDRLGRGDYRWFGRREHLANHLGHRA